MLQIVAATGAGEQHEEIGHVGNRGFGLAHTHGLDQDNIEARGFCTQPAHAVRGKGDVLVSTFEFAGPVNFSTETT